MKIGIIGMGAVGTACAFSVVMRGCADELVLLDRDRSADALRTASKRIGAQADA